MSKSKYVPYGDGKKYKTREEYLEHRHAYYLSHKKQYREYAIKNKELNIIKNGRKLIKS